MYRSIWIAFFLVSVCACNSIDHARQNFKEARNYDVGRKIGDVPLAEPVRMVPSDNGYTEYHYAFYNPETKSDCSWVYLIDEDPNTVKSWRYTGDPEACFESVWLGNPW